MPYVTSAERIGREAGLKQGRQECLLAGIELGLKLKFGAEGLLPEIRQIAEVEMLRRIHQAIETAANPDDLRKVCSGASA
ncbi:MAG TPA: hypothetical protein VGX76_24095 [Pirellulales bacterium]|nr:hypothetical protein [Pirellulales bacterium]